jgi:hypothetical protein
VSLVCHRVSRGTDPYWDIEYIEWHPTMALLVSGSKDNLITFWDPGTGTTVITPYVSRTLPSGQGKHVDAS